MAESDTLLTALGLTVSLTGIAVMIFAGVLLYRNSMRQSELERALKYPVKSNDHQRLTDGVRTAAADPEAGAEPADLLALQVKARSLLSHRVYLWLFTGLLMQQLGSLINRPSPGRIAFFAVIALITLVATYRVERNARSAAAFLRRYPLSPEAHAR